MGWPDEGHQRHAGLCLLTAMRALRPFLLTLVLLLAAAGARADLVVVMAASGGVRELSREAVINIFLGRYRQLPSGQLAKPLDLLPADPLRERFYRKLVDKNPAEISAYWTRLIFSGKTSPPEIVASVPELIKQLNNTPGAIAYLERSQLDERLRVVLSLGD